MNANDRQGLRDLSDKIDALTSGLSTLEYLGKEETVEVLKDLVKIAPTLKDLAQGYKFAGVAGNFVKWVAGIATAIVALGGVIRLFFLGDAK